jgi:hypothetical protein
MNPEGQLEDSGLHSHSKITEKYNHEFLVFDLSQEELTLGGRGNERMGREVKRQGSCHPLFNGAILHSPKCPWIHKS